MMGDPYFMAATIAVVYGGLLVVGVLWEAAERIRRKTMNNKDTRSAKAYLRRIRQEQREIHLLMEHREALYSLLYPGAIRYDNNKVQAPSDDVFSKRIAEIYNTEDIIVKHVAEMDKRKAKAMSIIRLMDDATRRIVLEAYYLSTKPNGQLYRWDEVARIVGYAEKYVLRKIHPEALREFWNIMSSETGEGG